jgi:hypothetical protein
VNHLFLDSHAAWKRGGDFLPFDKTDIDTVQIITTPGGEAFAW